MARRPISIPAKAATVPTVGPVAAASAPDAVAPLQISGRYGASPWGDFERGSDGTPRLSWARSTHSTTWGSDYASPYTITIGNAGNRNHAKAAGVATALSLENSTLATIVDVLDTHTVGTGLKLSLRLDAKRLSAEDSVDPITGEPVQGVTDDQAEELSQEIESKFEAWAANPYEVDITGRFNLHELASLGFRSFLTTGELLAVVEWTNCRGARTKTKIGVLSHSQIDVTRNFTNNPNGTNTFMGVTFDAATGRRLGYWIRAIPTGSQIQTPLPKYVEAATPWGRTKVIHLFVPIASGQVRGLSPLTAALTPAHERNSLGEFTLDSALLQTMYSLTIESDLPPDAALASMGVNHTMSGGTTAPAGDWLSVREGWYSKAKIAAQPGIINHLAPGDKLKMNRSETPNSTYVNFDKSLTRQASRAAGAMVEDVNGDYSDTSFSASRLATETPYRQMLRKRKSIVEAFYKRVFAAWLEEALATGDIVPPKGTRPYWGSEASWTAARFIGAGRIIADPKKQADADILELENHLCTLEDKLAERGLDMDDVLKQRAREKTMLEKYGLNSADLVGVPAQGKV